jgi:phage gp36-like protein
MYSTLEDIKKLVEEAILVQLTDDAATGEVDTGVVASAITEADGTINSYCQGRYTLPLYPVPPRVVGLSVDIAIYNLYSRRVDEMPEIRKDRFKEAIRFLELVAAGKVELGATSPTAQSTANTVDIESGARVFTRDKMKGF